MHGDGATGHPGGAMFTRPHHDLIYAQPRYFDIAFDNRDLDTECGFLRHLSRHLGIGRLNSFLETCCGPGYHMHWFARRGVRAYGIEFSAEMVAYAREKACRVAAPIKPCAEPPAEARRDAVTHTPQAVVLQADLRDFTLSEAVDLAFCPRGALGYILEDDELIAHFVAIAKNLGRGGLYVLELDHPSQFFRGGEDESRGARTWKVQRDGVRINVQWGTGREPIDPLTHIRDLEAILEVEDGDHLEVIHDVAPVRSFTYRELRALVGLSGVFEWLTAFGDLTMTQPFDASPGARALVPILRCCI